MNTVEKAKDTLNVYEYKSRVCILNSAEAKIMKISQALIEAEKVIKKLMESQITGKSIPASLNKAEAWLKEHSGE